MAQIKMYNSPEAEQTGQACCAPPQRAGLQAPDMHTRQMAAQSLAGISTDRPAWISGMMNTPAGIVPVVTPLWSRSDRWGQIKARAGSFRMGYSVKPGLYAVGAPDANSDVFASANYKLSFDILRRALAGISGWILVLDTKGINVWCAAGKGTFGTEEMVKRITDSRLTAIVTHRRIIVPQLGAVGVRASDVKKKTGFHVHFGPILANDIPEYLQARYKATPEMRKVPFTVLDRLVLVPIELNPVLKKYPVIALVFLAIFGLQPSGILFNNAWFEGWPFLLLCLVSALTGSVVTPALLPIIPFRSFALKGWALGAAVVTPLVALTPAGGESLILKAAALTLFPLLSSYLALQFTGATTFTTISGVKKELKLWLPIYIGGLAASAILIILYKLQSWGII